MKILKKLFSFFALLFLVLANAAEDPETPPSGGVGGTTPGARVSPIDDYIFLLLPLAIMLIIYFAYKYRKQLSR